MGKSALAVHWAHQVADRFPDGQLHADMRGFDQAGLPAGPSEVILNFLSALGVPPDATPGSLDAQAVLYRSLLTNRRMLVLLDNARDSAQVRPLLPGSPGCLVVVTSRAELTGLVAGEDAHPLALDVLSDPEASVLLADCIGEQRAAAEQEAVGDLAELCARLPLALRVVAARAVTRPSLPLAALAGELRDAGRRLDALSAGEPDTDVRTAFSWSYRQLGAAAGRMFRLLGISPGPDISLPAAASLAGIAAAEASRALGELSRTHLVNERTAGRFACHDLLRDYAAELAGTEEPAAERAAATRRLLTWFLHTADAADGSLDSRRHMPLGPPPPNCEPLFFANAQQALAWFEYEYVNLAAAVLAEQPGNNDIVAMLSAVMHHFVDLRRPLGEWIRYGRVGIKAARLADDAFTEAVLLNRLGSVHLRLGQYQDAVGCYQAALRIRRETGDQTGEGATLNNLGACCWETGQYDPALGYFEQALTIARQTANRYEQAISLGNIAETKCMLGEPERALAYHREALDLMRKVGNTQHEARMLSGLALTYRALGRFADAHHCYQRALGLCQSAGDRYIESDALTELGDLLSETGQPAAARTSWRNALAIRMELRHPDTQSLRAKLASFPPEPADEV